MIHIENKCRTWNTHLHLFKSILLFEHPFHHSVRPSQGFQDTHSKLDVSHTSILWWNLRFATFCHRQWWRPWKEVLGGSCYLEGRFPNEGSYIKPNSPTTFKDVADCFPVFRLFLVHCLDVYIYILIFGPRFLLILSVCVVWCESSRVYTLNGVFVRIPQHWVEQNHVPPTVISMKYTRCLLWKSNWEMEPQL